MFMKPRFYLYIPGFVAFVRLYTASTLILMRLLHLQYWSLAKSGLVGSNIIKRTSGGFANFSSAVREMPDIRRRRREKPETDLRCQSAV